VSKAAQQIIGVCALLVFIVGGWGAFGWIQKAQMQQANTLLTKQVDDAAQREKTYLLENNTLKTKVQEIEKANADLETRLSEFKDINIADIDKQIKDISAQRDELKKRVETLSSERDSLAAKLAEKEKASAAAAVTSDTQQKAESAESGKITTEGIAAYEPAISTQQKDEDLASQQEQDAYWAKVLKEKADLQLKVENLTATLNSTNVELVELKKKNSDIQLALSELKSDKEAIEREIKHGKDLADTLSLELARAQNEKKFLNDRVEKLLGENSTLRDQIKQLSSTKIALEKSIVRLQDEKKVIEKKLIETENVIQSRVDQIWSIKESLDKDFRPAQAKNAGKIELSPIVVSQTADTSAPAGIVPGFNGNVVSINKENNFVIVDIGENTGLRVGDTLSVYRGTQYVAGLEVIQLRKDIAAADIKDQVSEIQVGDVVR